ncbi:MAG: response regulator [Deltaproteobacteria bacterium]|nr:response regulator [Deltaproteobacteria bacterium]
MGVASKEALKAFRQETDERLQHMEGLLVRLEKAPTDEAIAAEIARDLHTLKGTAGMFKLAAMAELSHHTEDVLAALVSGGLAPAPAVFSALLAVVDELRAFARAAVDGGNTDRDCSALHGRLDELFMGGAGEGGGEVPGDEPAPAEVPRSSAPNTEPAGPLRRIVTEPAGPLRPIATELAGSLWPSTTEPASHAGGDWEATDQRPDTIRTDIGKLDTIMNLVGEAAISRTKADVLLRETHSFVKRCEAMRKLAGGLRSEVLAVQAALDDRRGRRMVARSNALWAQAKELRAALRDFRIAFDSHSLEDQRLLDSLQHEVAEIRMVPLSVLFERFPRAVRDLAVELDKQVEVEVSGGATRLDQKVIENVEAPLTHILRNAVGHGIERPSERRASGKDEQGRVRISAFQEGGRIAIVIEDDGRGLDPSALRRAAVRQGLLSSTEAANLSDREAPYLICARGFSTAVKVTETAGRGVGMDVVKRVIEDSKGELSIDSTVGQGTTIKISLPLTLAVTQVLVVEVAGRSLCIPTLSIEMVRVVRPEQLQTVAERLVVASGRRAVPFVPLATVLGLPGEVTPSEGGIPTVFLAHARQRIALAVDRMVTEQQIVIKPLGKVLAQVPNVAGATILGSGDVSPVLHPPDLVRNGLTLLGHTVPMALTTKPERGARPQRQRVLVVDDAMSTREMVRDILAAEGLEADTAVDGQDGLKKSQQTTYDLFVVDIEMPKMDGFELVAALRKNEQLGDTPIIILSSRGSEEDKRRGLDVGADAYLTKRGFTPAGLIETVVRLTGVRMSEGG